MGSSDAGHFLWIERDSGVPRSSIEALRAAIAPMIEANKAKGGRSHAFAEVSGDLSLARFLEGWSGSVEKAAAAFERMLEWRLKWRADEVRDALMATSLNGMEAKQHLSAGMTHVKHWDKVKQVYPERVFFKTAKNGNPVMITVQRMIQNLPGLMVTVDASEYNEFRVYRLINRQILLHRLSVDECRIVKMIFVWDLADFKMKTLSRLKAKSAKNYFGDFDEEQKDAFPEIVDKLIAINVPWFLSAMWSVAKRLLPKRTLAKIVVARTGESALSKLIFPIIPPENIPTSLGGKCTDRASEFVRDADEDTSSTNLQTKIVIPRRDAREHIVKFLPTTLERR